MKQWFLSLPDAIRAGINTAWQSALGLFAVVMLGFLAKVQEWAGSTDPNATFPSVSPLGKAVASILVGLVTGVLVAVFRYFKPGPSYSSTPAGEPNDRGSITLTDIVLVLFGVAIVVWLVITLKD